MSIQFKHNRNIGERLSSHGGETIAAEVNTESLESLQVGDCVDLNLGIAKCSSKDCFNRQIGRNLAISRLKNINLKVLSISKELRNDDQVYTRLYLRNQDISVIITRSSNNRKFRLSSVLIY